MEDATLWSSVKEVQLSDHVQQISNALSAFFLLGFLLCKNAESGMTRNIQDGMRSMYEHTHIQDDIFIFICTCPASSNDTGSAMFTTPVSLNP